MSLQVGAKVFLKGDNTLSQPFIVTALKGRKFQIKPAHDGNSSTRDVYVSELWQKTESASTTLASSEALIVENASSNGELNPPKNVSPQFSPSSLKSSIRLESLDVSTNVISPRLSLNESLNGLESPKSSKALEETVVIPNEKKENEVIHIDNKDVKGTDNSSTKLPDPKSQATTKSNAIVSINLDERKDKKSQFVAAGKISNYWFENASVDYGFDTAVPPNSSIYFNSSIKASIFVEFVISFETEYWTMSSGDVIKSSPDEVEIFGLAGYINEQKFIVLFIIDNDTDSHLKTCEVLSLDEFIISVNSGYRKQPKTRLSDPKQIASLVKAHFSWIKVAHLARFNKGIIDVDNVDQLSNRTPGPTTVNVTEEDDEDNSTIRTSGSLALGQVDKPGKRFSSRARTLLSRYEPVLTTPSNNKKPPKAATTITASYDSTNTGNTTTSKSTITTKKGKGKSRGPSFLNSDEEDNVSDPPALRGKRKYTSNYEYGEGLKHYQSLFPSTKTVADNTAAMSALTSQNDQLIKLVQAQVEQNAAACSNMANLAKTQAEESIKMQTTIIKLSEKHTEATKSLQTEFLASYTKMAEGRAEDAKNNQTILNTHLGTLMNHSFALNLQDKQNLVEMKRIEHSASSSSSSASSSSSSSSSDPFSTMLKDMTEKVQLINNFNSLLSNMGSKSESK